jgi:hypothetical protein
MLLENPQGRNPLPALHFDVLSIYLKSQTNLKGNNPWTIPPFASRKVFLARAVVTLLLFLFVPPVGKAVSIETPAFPALKVDQKRYAHCKVSRFCKTNFDSKAHLFCGCSFHRTDTRSAESLYT